MKNLPIIGLLALATCLSCEFDPVLDEAPNCTPSASFEPNEFEQEIGLPISMLNVRPEPSSECPYTYSWDFGDNGGIKVGQDPGPHLYATEGTYEITLTVSTVNPPFETDSFTREVRIFNPVGPPVAVAVANPDSCLGPCTITFSGTASTGNVEYYQWDFGYDDQVGDGATVTHTFPPRREPYQVSLTVGNSEEDSSQTIPVTVSWLTFVQEGIEMQSLGRAIHLSKTSGDRYNIVGSKDLGGGMEGIYTLLANENGQIVGDPVVLDNLSDEDVAQDAIQLANNDIMVVGTTIENNRNSILFLRFNPLAPDNPTLLRIGQAARGEVGRAVCEVIEGGQVELAITGEVFDASGYSVYFRTFSLNGTPRLPDEQLIQFPGITPSLVEVKDILRTSNGQYWICGWLQTQGRQRGQAFILELNDDGSYANHRLFSDTDIEDQFLGMATNASGDQILVVGTSYDFLAGSRAMRYAFVAQDDLANASWETVPTDTVERASTVRLLDDGRYLIMGAGARGPALALMRPNGTLVHSHPYGGFGEDQFYAGLASADGGYAAAGGKGAKILFVKTDDQLVAN